MIRRAAKKVVYMEKNTLGRAGFFVLCGGRGGGGASRHNCASSAEAAHRQAPHTGPVRTAAAERRKTPRRGARNRRSRPARRRKSLDRAAVQRCARPAAAPRAGRSAQTAPLQPQARGRRRRTAAPAGRARVRALRAVNPAKYLRSVRGGRRLAPASAKGQAG